MAENTQKPAAGSAPAKPKPAAGAAKPAAPGAAKPAAPAAAKPAAPGAAKAPAKPAAPAAAAPSGVYKPPVDRPAADPYKDSKLNPVTAWLQERFYVLTPIIDYMKHKEVPKHRLSFWYYFGGLGLFFFIIQIVTGLLLLQYYKPTEATAFASFVFIQKEVPFGWLLRQVHAWSANLMILMLFIHMFSTFFMKSYRKPRE
ncbi:MAG: cytochrome B, partial [Chlorobaculum sp.]|nr:cytochrome B [Chlorobaculum sp.]